MAACLVRAGHDVVVWNRTSAKTEALVASGARTAASPAESARDAEVVITMLATPDAVRQVILGAQGVAGALPAGAVIIEMSTVGPTAVVDLGQRLNATRGGEGVELLDAPVLGSVPQAQAGNLRIFVGGSEDTLARCGKVLEAMGEPVHVGPSGAGAAVKLVINSALGALMGSLGEALALGDAWGLDEAILLDALEVSPLGPTVTRKRQNIAGETYPPSFKLALARKDMALVVEVAAQAGLHLRIAHAAKDWLDEADESGLGDLDYSSVVAQIRGAPASLGDD
ncbi:MAG: NAD(P)-dependent oxidoreductase [Actinomycetota bacterium]|nr:NAD(P)-dependent oxidoreductase [Actinomycetota bacterium]